MQTQIEISSLPLEILREVVCFVDDRIDLGNLFLSNKAFLSSVSKRDISKLKRKMAVCVRIQTAKAREEVEGFPKRRKFLSMIFHGSYKKFDGKENLIEEGKYKNGKKCGKWKKTVPHVSETISYHSKGSHFQEEKVYNLDLTGPRLIYSHRRQNGILDGPFVSFYDNGQKWEEGTWKKGILVGERKAWHRNGTLKYVFVHSDVAEG
jgi:hypothetical protein